MADKKVSTAPQFTNKLSTEKSPYLRQHAHNPVNWMPWGEDAFETARHADKPIFLSVGYSACHWCHVMERESFENTETAEILNQHFVAIKVDREERPDVDEIYMTAVQMMTGHGGWPMSVFLLPDGRPFYGGTYFPPTNHPGRIGFPSLLTQLADAYQNRRDEIAEVAARLAEDLEKATRQRPVEIPHQPLDAKNLLDNAMADLAERFDAENGGFGGAPKFPPHHALRLLITAVSNGDTNAPRLLHTTLDTMARGGIYDQIGGGFHRYSTDALWLLPHFEKMLYDNALLTRVYAEAFRVTGKAAYARIARETCDWVLREMTAKNGGFFSALDADSEGEEGKYYVWTRAEAEQIAGANFCQRYHLEPGGNFRDEATGHASRANIPYLALGAAAAAATPLPDELSPEMAAARTLLLQTRQQRVAPGRDDKILTGWNGLMIGALAVAGHAIGEPRYIEAAERAANFCLTTLLLADGPLQRRWADGETAIAAFLDDYAYLADGLLDLRDATGNAHWRDAAAGLADTLLDRFWDAEDSGFFYTGTHHEPLIARSKELFDGALPSANGVAVRVLARLGGDYWEKARQILTAFSGVLTRAPHGTATWIETAARWLPDSATEKINQAALTAEPNRITFAPGAAQSVEFRLHLAENWHLSAPLRSVRLTSDLPAALGPVQLPETVSMPQHGEETPPVVFAGDSVFTVPISLASNAAPGSYDLTLTVSGQVCSDRECLPPQELSGTAVILVTPTS